MRGGCDSSVGLPLLENGSIVEQPLDLWTLTDRYESTALRIIRNARYTCRTMSNPRIDMSSLIQAPYRRIKNKTGGVKLFVAVIESPESPLLDAYRLPQMQIHSE